MRELIKNKPWKAWKTRKITFCYMLILGTAAIIVSGFLTNFSESWLDLVLKFCKFVVGTGTILILAPSFDALVKVKKGEDEC